MAYQKNDNRFGGQRGGFGSKPYNRDNKPFNRDNRSQDGDNRPYGKRNDRDDRPYGKRNDREDRPYGRRNEMDDRPFDKRGGRFDRAERSAERSFERAEQPKPERANDELPFIILGRNAVKEAIKSGRSIDYILVNKEMDGSLREIVSLAREHKLVIRETDRHKLDEVCMPFGHGDKTGNHQGIVAYAAGVEYCTVADILRCAKDRGEEPFVIVLDGVEDPHNLGSIIRSAECAGAHGVVIGKRRSASVTAATVKASAGATSHMNIARVVNINVAIDELKKAGLWVAGAHMEGVNMHKQGLNGAIALVIGNEGEGLSKLVKDNCDFLVSIPMKGKLDSLNAAVAAAILMFEKNRQDDRVSD